MEIFPIELEEQETASHTTPHECESETETQLLLESTNFRHVNI